ncbi:MAG TPA: TraB/GumN family protein [Kofleriaceae bacterium]
MTRIIAILTLVAGIACRSHDTPSTPTTVAGPTSAETGAAARAAQPAPSDPLPHPLFWSIEKDGKTTYLLGTMHVGIDAQARLPAIVWAKFHAATTFAMEANLDDPEAAAMIKPTGVSLHDQLGEVYWKKLVDALGPGMARAFDHLPPLVPATALSTRGLPTTDPMDKTLAARAAAEHKQLIYLEQAKFQIALLAKWMDLKALKVALDELPSNEQHARDTIAAYVSGDEAGLLAIRDGEREDALHHGYTEAEYDQEMTELLFNRNASWIDAIDRLHTVGGGFVAVGALHLLGAHSVLELLAQRGYRITRITP